MQLIQRNATVSGILLKEINIPQKTALTVPNDAILSSSQLFLELKII